MVYTGKKERSIRKEQTRMKNLMNTMLEIKSGKRLLPSLIVLVCWCMHTQAQLPFSTAPEKAATRNGNKEFEKENYAEAEAEYKKALDKKNNMPEANFNLGDAQYQQKRYEEAEKQFTLSAKTNSDKSVQAKAYHNLGNSFLSREKYEDAVRAYKESLKLNPSDVETKYNLAYANAKLKSKNQGGEGQDKQQQKDQQQKQQEQQNKEQKENEQNKDQQSENKEQQKDGQKKQGQQPKISREDAQKMLQALQNEEQKTNQKMQQKQVKVTNVKIEKDW